MNRIPIAELVRNRFFGNILPDLGRIRRGFAPSQLIGIQPHDPIRGA